jgi:hypothetical protein
MNTNCTYQTPQVVDLGAIEQIQGLADMYYWDGGDGVYAYYNG